MIPGERCLLCKVETSSCLKLIAHGYQLILDFPVYSGSCRFRKIGFLNTETLIMSYESNKSGTPRHIVANDDILCVRDE